MVCRDCQSKNTKETWHSCLAMLSAMTFNNTAKSGNVLSSNITRKDTEMENSNGKQPLFQLLNIMLIIYIRWCCSVHPSESVTMYLGKQIILLLPATGLWHLFPQHMVLCTAITDKILGPKDRSCVKWKLWEDVHKRGGFWHDKYYCKHSSVESFLGEV